MKVSLLTIGAMGDTQPFVALAVRLKAQGHSVTLAARPDFESLARSYGVEFTPLGNPYKLIMGDQQVAAAVGSGSLVKLLKQGSDKRQRQTFFERLDTDTMRAVEGAEAVIYKSSWIPFSSYAEKTGIPCIGAMLMPLTRTRAFPSFLLGSGTDRGTLINSFLWRLTEQGIWQVARKYDTKVRRELLNLPPLPFLGPSGRSRQRAIPLLYAYSPHVLPRPSDWPARIHVTGYWFSDPPPGWAPPPEVVSLLDDGPPPVYIGFGSMTGGNPEETLSMILNALELSGQRGILLSGWAGLGEGRQLPDYAVSVQSIPHSWLFSRVAAVVHHGGAGTTGAGLRAGVPSVLTPFVADQPSWAKRVEALGVGPRPIPFRELTARRLAEAIRLATTDEGIRQRAAALGERIRAEDGVGVAVEIFLSYAKRG
ncbi:MAG TPA: glycosyltransferase [Spirochaetia bacterium]|nr:glycosyltransferase [Spirochaetia bacterium]